MGTHRVALTDWQRQAAPAGCAAAHAGGRYAWKSSTNEPLRNGPPRVPRDQCGQSEGGAHGKSGRLSAARPGKNQPAIGAPATLALGSAPASL
jgi:phage tail tape-measure protein